MADCGVPQALAGAIQAKGISQRQIPRPTTKIARDLLYRALLVMQVDDGIGDWIFSGLMRESLVIRHDGSYMPHLANNVCACALVIYCSHTDQFTDVTWVEKSKKKVANNYRAEILGGCSTYQGSYHWTQCGRTPYT